MIQFKSTVPGKAGAYAICVEKGLKAFAAAAVLGKALDSDTAKALKKVADFTVDAGDVANLTLAGKDGRIDLFFYGAGKSFDADSIKDMAKKLYAALAAAKVQDAVIVLPEKLDAGGFYVQLSMAAYSFDKYKTKPAAKKIKKITLAGGKGKVDADACKAMADAVANSRAYVDEPANALTPQKFAQSLAKLKDLGVKVNVMDRQQLEKEGLNLIIAVGRGSANPPCLVIMQYQGALANAGYAALAGKGVCFDSGGINIKDAPEEMFQDMTGAAIVAGAIEYLARVKARVNVVATVALVENMPGCDALKPGDIIKSYKGKTVEIANTDAEGRLILADAMAYVQDKFAPKAMVDVATLTGLAVMMFKERRAALFPSSDKLAAQLEKAGEKTGELLWSLPMDDYYGDLMKSSRADISNYTSTGGGGRGSPISAAKFLEAFVDTRKTQWAHIDLANTTFIDRMSTGWGVRLLTTWILDNFANGKPR